MSNEETLTKRAKKKKQGKIKIDIFVGFTRLLYCTVFFFFWRQHDGIKMLVHPCSRSFCPTGQLFLLEIT